MRIQIKTFLFFALCALFLFTSLSSAIALMTGIGFALFLSNSWPKQTGLWSGRLLQISVVGLAGGMTLEEVGKAGLHGLGITLAGLVLTFGVAQFLGGILSVETEARTLVTSGTAICGGSAIAAVASVIGASGPAISVSLGVVFILNAIGLVIFPPLGHHFGLTQSQFGLWSALAIHDTSSVVGAALRFGHEALLIAVPVKLGRALWIIPMSLVIAFFYRKQSATHRKFKIPWFILWFLGLSVFLSIFPTLREWGHLAAEGAKHTLVLTLFLIGSNLTPSALKSVGPRPLIFGILLWFWVATTSLAAVMQGWI